MIQWIVAAQVGRDLRYLTWGNERLASELKSLSQSLGAMDVTVGQMWQALIQFCDEKEKFPQVELFSWLRDFFFDFEDSGRSI